MLYLAYTKKLESIKKKKVKIEAKHLEIIIAESFG